MTNALFQPFKSIDVALGVYSTKVCFSSTAVWSKGLAFPTGLHMAINVVLALVGQKDSRHAIWNLEYTTEITPVLRAQTEHIGMIMQLCILLIVMSKG